MEGSTISSSWGKEVLTPSGFEGLTIKFLAGSVVAPLNDIVLTRFFVQGQLTGLAKLPRNPVNQRLEFRIGTSVWDIPADTITDNGTDPEKAKFSLIPKAPKYKQTRLCDRWDSDLLFQVHGELINNLECNQSTPFVLHDISVGGLSFNLKESISIIVSQKTNVQIDFPHIGRAECPVRIKALEKINGYQRVHASFEPLSNDLVDKVGRYLVGYKNTTNLEKLELDLTSSKWPKEAIQLLSTKIDSEQTRIEQKIQQSLISGVTIKSTTPLASELFDFQLTETWAHEDQLSTLIPKVIGRCLARNELEVVYKNATPDLSSFGFRNSASKQVLKLEDSTLSTKQWYQLSKAMSQHPLELPLQPTLCRRTYKYLVDAGAAIIPKRNEGTPALSWDKYGMHYDNLCNKNPSYQELLAEYQSWIEESSHIKGRVLDIGAGTGNFSLKTASALPEARILHIDQDIIMNRFAQQKYRDAGYENIEIKTCSIDELDFPGESISMVTAFHSLYTMRNPKAILEQIFDWLKPEGHFYVIDIGRTINVGEWTKHLFIANAKQQGIRETASYFWQNREVIRQNRKIQESQETGEFWNKTTASFEKALRNTGFAIERQAVRYRGISDLFVCRKPS